MRPQQFEPVLFLFVWLEVCVWLSVAPGQAAGRQYSRQTALQAHTSQMDVPQGFPQRGVPHKGVHDVQPLIDGLQINQRLLQPHLPPGIGCFVCFSAVLGLQPLGCILQLQYTDVWRMHTFGSPWACSVTVSLRAAMRLLKRREQAQSPAKK